MADVTGIVIEEQKNYVVVDAAGKTVRATISGALRKNRARPYVGDVVDVSEINADSADGVVLAVHPRKNVLKRPAVANMDQALLVCTIKEPPLDLAGLDRFLLNVAHSSLDSILVINKCDILNDHDRATAHAYIAVYESLGCRVITTSALTGQNIDTLLALCQSKCSFFAGLSGVGKSSLLMRIFPGKTFRTNHLSAQSGRGVHTTTATSLLRLPEGGYIADTPGYSFVTLPALNADDLRFYFPEIEQRGDTCRFHDCQHLDEPSCAVKEAVEAGSIARWRYENYLSFYDELSGRKQRPINKKRARRML